jgi:hypothetical protein
VPNNGIELVVRTLPRSQDSVLALNVEHCRRRRPAACTAGGTPPGALRLAGGVIVCAAVSLVIAAGDILCPDRRFVELGRVAAID